MHTIIPLSHTLLLCAQMAMQTSPKLEEVGRMDSVDMPAKSFQVQQLKARSNTVPSKLNTSQMSADDEVFHHLAMQLNMIDNLAQRERSRSGTPEFLSPTKRQSPDPTGVIDLSQYSGMAPSSIETEAASNKYFEFSGAVEEDSPEEPLPEKRERHASTGESPAMLKASGVCARLDYPRVQITGNRSIADFAGVSAAYCIAQNFVWEKFDGD